MRFTRLRKRPRSFAKETAVFFRPLYGLTIRKQNDRRNLQFITYRPDYLTIYLMTKKGGRLYAASVRALRTV